MSSVLHQNLLKEWAESLYEVMLKISQDFRLQPGNRYTNTEKIAEDAGGQIEVEDEAHTSAVRDLRLLVGRQIAVAEDMCNTLNRLQESHRLSVEASRSVVKAF